MGVAAGDVARTRPENKQNNDVRGCKGLFSASAATGWQKKPNTNLAADESKNAAAINGGNVRFSRDGRGNACVPSEWVEG